MRKFQNKSQFLTVFLMAGFVGGILYANLISGQCVTTSGIFSEYFLNQYTQMEIVTEDYIWYVMRVRIVPFLGICFLGCTRWKKVLVGGVLGWTGFSGGLLAVSAVMRLGIKGLVVCLVGLFPQACFYILAYAVLLIYLYRYPEGRWNAGKTVFILLDLVIGILLETYVNPVLMKMIIKVI